MAGLKVAGGTNETTRLTKKGKFFDYTLLIVVLFLVAFGLVMVYSTSSFSALQDTGDSAYYFKRQLLTSGIGLVAMTKVVNKYGIQVQGPRGHDGKAHHLRRGS